jgi:transposase
MRVIQPYRKFSDPFVQDAVALMDRTDRSFQEVAEGLGISAWTLRRWYNEHVAKTKKPKNKPARREVPAVITEAETEEGKIARLERENAALRKQVENLETDRAILKKAAAFFAKESE